MNSLTLAGRLTADPEPGPACALIRVRPDNHGAGPEDTGALTAVARDDLAASVVDFLRRGDRVILSGRPRTAAERADDDTAPTADIEIADIGPSLQHAGALILRGPTPTDPGPPRKVAVTTDDNDAAAYQPGKQPTGQLTLDDG